MGGAYRTSRVQNGGTNRVPLATVACCCCKSRWESTHASAAGAWARERKVLVSHLSPAHNSYASHTALYCTLSLFLQQTGRPSETDTPNHRRSTLVACLLARFNPQPSPHASVAAQHAEAKLPASPLTRLSPCTPLKRCIHPSSLSPALIPSVRTPLTTSRY